MSNSQTTDMAALDSVQDQALLVGTRQWPADDDDMSIGGWSDGLRAIEEFDWGPSPGDKATEPDDAGEQMLDSSCIQSSPCAVVPEIHCPVAGASPHEQPDGLRDTLVIVSCMPQPDSDEKRDSEYNYVCSTTPDAGEGYPTPRPNALSSERFTEYPQCSSEPASPKVRTHEEGNATTPYQLAVEVAEAPTMLAPVSTVPAFALRHELPPSPFSAYASPLEPANETNSPKLMSQLLAGIEEAAAGAPSEEVVFPSAEDQYIAPITPVTPGLLQNHVVDEDTSHESHADPDVVDVLPPAGDVSSSPTRQREVTMDPEHIDMNAETSGLASIETVPETFGDPDSDIEAEEQTAMDDGDTGSTPRVAVPPDTTHTSPAEPCIPEAAFLRHSREQCLGIISQSSSEAISQGIGLETTSQAKASPQFPGSGPSDEMEAEQGVSSFHPEQNPGPAITQDDDMDNGVGVNDGKLQFAPPAEHRHEAVSHNAVNQPPPDRELCPNVLASQNANAVAAPQVEDSFEPPAMPPNADLNTAQEVIGKATISGSTDTGVNSTVVPTTDRDEDTDTEMGDDTKVNAKATLSSPQSCLQQDDYDPIHVVDHHEQRQLETQFEDMTLTHSDAQYPTPQALPTLPTSGTTEVSAPSPTQGTDTVAEQGSGDEMSEAHLGAPNNHAARSPYGEDVEDEHLASTVAEPTMGSPEIKDQHKNAPDTAVASPVCESAAESLAETPNRGLAIEHPRGRDEPDVEEPISSPDTDTGVHLDDESTERSPKISPGSAEEHQVPQNLPEPSNVKGKRLRLRVSPAKPSRVTHLSPDPEVLQLPSEETPKIDFAGTEEESQVSLTMSSLAKPEEPTMVADRTSEEVPVPAGEHTDLEDETLDDIIDDLSDAPSSEVGLTSAKASNLDVDSDTPALVVDKPKSGRFASLKTHKVERLVDERVKSNRLRKYEVPPKQYRVKWVGLSGAKNLWINFHELNVFDPEIIKRYHAGLDNITVADDAVEDASEEAGSIGKQTKAQRITINTESRRKAAPISLQEPPKPSSPVSATDTPSVLASPKTTKTIPKAKPRSKLGLAKRVGPPKNPSSNRRNDRDFKPDWSEDDDEPPRKKAKKSKAKSKSRRISTDGTNDEDTSDPESDAEVEDGSDMEGSTRETIPSHIPVVGKSSTHAVKTAAKFSIRALAHLPTAEPTPAPDLNSVAQTRRATTEKAAAKEGSSSRSSGSVLTLKDLEIRYDKRTTRGDTKSKAGSVVHDAPTSATPVIAKAKAKGKTSTAPTKAKAPLVTAKPKATVTPAKRKAKEPAASPPRKRQTRRDSENLSHNLRNGKKARKST